MLLLSNLASLLPMTVSEPADLADGSGLWGDPGIAQRIKREYPRVYDTLDDVARAGLAPGHLTQRMCELILLAMHASAASLDETAILRHINRARVAGASDADVVDVLMTIAGVATHAIYATAPILLEELGARGLEPEVADPSDLGAYEDTKAAFLDARDGFWNPGRDIVASVMPRLARALIAQGMESWKTGTLSTKEREFVCIAIDATITHTYEAGLRLHVRRAIDAGASADELIEVVQLAALLGFEGLVLGAQAIATRSPRA